MAVGLRLAIVMVVAAVVSGACGGDAKVAALERAIRAGDVAAVAEALTSGASPDSTLAGAWTPLTLAASLGHTPIAAALLDAGADIERARRVGVERQWTPLGWAALGGHGDLVNLLLDRGARVDARTSRHQTPLMAAATGGHRATMARLVAAGADEDAVDAEGRRASDLVP